MNKKGSREMPKITKRFVDTIIPDGTKPVIFWDTELKGFGVVVLPSGRRTYCVQYRNQDRVKRRLKIGVHGAITTEEARTRAKTYLMRVFQGKDPLGERQIKQKEPTFDDLVFECKKRFSETKRLKTLNNEDHIPEKYIIPTFTGKKVCTIKAHDMESLHSKLKDKSYQANRVLSLLSSMFSRALYWGWIPKNPVQGIARYPEPKRERWLSPEEVSRLWKVLDAYSTSFSAYLCKRLLLTGARKGETLKARWDHFDLEKGIWTKPSHLTKQKKTERLPLSKQAVAVLREIEDL
jgi:integrase